MIASNRFRWQLALTLSVAAVVVAAYPWGAVVWHPHWDRVGWVPFLSAHVRLRDVAANLLLCAPIGVCAARLFTHGPLASATITLALSLGLETMQLYSHGRFPSATDVLCNVTGAVIAASLVTKYWPVANSEVRP